MRLLLLLLLKADFYLQLNAEPQRPSSKEDGSSTDAHTQKNVHLYEQWLTTTMYVSVHFYNGKKTIWSIFKHFRYLLPRIL